MSSRTQIWLFIALIAGGLLIAAALNHFSLENKYKRSLQYGEELRERSQLRKQQHAHEANIREQKIRQHNMQVSAAFEAGRCQDFFKPLETEEFIPRYDNHNILQADLLMRGKCREQDFQKAFEIYQTELAEISHFKDVSNGVPLKLFPEYYGHMAHIKFRLATLYWRGQGVFQDKNKAQALFHQAAITLGPWLSTERHLHKFDPAVVGPPNIWHMTNAEILGQAAFHATGPWNMPEPMMQEINWLIQIDNKGGKAVFEVGRHLLDGTGGFDKNPAMAYEWIYIASEIHDYGPAHYLRAMLLRSQEFADLRQDFPIFSIDFGIFGATSRAIRVSNRLLLLAAEEGDIRADKALLRLFKLTPAYDEQNRDVYFWMLRIQQKNMADISESDISAARDKLSQKDQNFVADRVKNGFFPSVMIILDKDKRRSVPLNSL